MNLLVPVHHKTTPVVIQQQEERVGLRIVLNAEFDEARQSDRYLEPCDEILDDPIVAELGEYLELGVAEIPRSCPRMMRKQLARQKFKFIIHQCIAS